MTGPPPAWPPLIAATLTAGAHGGSATPGLPAVPMIAAGVVAGDHGRGSWPVGRLQGRKGGTWSPNAVRGKPLCTGMDGGWRGSTEGASGARDCGGIAEASIGNNLGGGEDCRGGGVGGVRDLVANRAGNTSATAAGRGIGAAIAAAAATAATTVASSLGMTGAGSGGPAIAAASTVMASGRGVPPADVPGRDAATCRASAPSPPVAAHPLRALPLLLLLAPPSMALRLPFASVTTVRAAAATLASPTPLLTASAPATGGA